MRLIGMEAQIYVTCLFHHIPLCTCDWSLVLADAMANATDCTSFFTQNTDITGLGVRLGLYLQLAIVGE